MKWALFFLLIVVITVSGCVDKCEDIDCNDYNPCTHDSCIGGKCTYSNLQDGTECGENKECISGVCTLESDDKNCTVGWKCSSYTMKAYQNSDCSWRNAEFCPYGCLDG